MNLVEAAIRGQIPKHDMHKYNLQLRAEEAARQRKAMQDNAQKRPGGAQSSMQPPSEKNLFVENGLAVQQNNNSVKVQAMAAMQAQVQHLQM